MVKLLVQNASIIQGWTHFSGLKAPFLSARFSVYQCGILCGFEIQIFQKDFYNEITIFLIQT